MTLLSWGWVNNLPAIQMGCKHVKAKNKIKFSLDYSLHLLLNYIYGKKKEIFCVMLCQACLQNAGPQNECTEVP